MTNKRSHSKGSHASTNHQTTNQASYRRPDTHRSSPSQQQQQQQQHSQSKASHRQSQAAAPRTPTNGRDVPAPTNAQQQSAWTAGTSRPYTSQGGLKPTYGVNSRPGQHGTVIKTNQDNFLMVNSSAGNFVAAVMDGHGEQGHNVSKFVKDNLAPQLVQCHSNVTGDINLDAVSKPCTHLT